MVRFRWCVPGFVPLIASLLLVGCSPVRFAGMSPTKGEQDLVAGINAYEEGDYREASKLLQNSLDSRLPLTDQLIKAHKYLAFIHCASGRESRCRDEFIQILGIDPSFELDPAEAGHPIWGPVFRGLKPRR